MLFREMNGGCYVNSMGRKYSAWQKCGFDVLAACTCIYHRPETVKVIKNVLHIFKAKKHRAGIQFSQWSDRLFSLTHFLLGAGKVMTRIFAVKVWDYFGRRGLKSYSEWYMCVLNLT